MAAVYAAASQPLTPSHLRLLTALRLAADTVNTQRINRLWVRSLYGDETVARLHAHPVLCSGFTAGTRHAILGAQRV